MNLDRHRRLFEITDLLLRLRRNPEALTRENYQSLLVGICASFRESLEHGLADVFLQLQQANDPDTIEEAQKVFYDVQCFAQYIEFQKEGLEACGLSPDTVENIIRQIEILREIIADMRYVPEELVAAVRRSTDQVCNSADKIKDGLSKQRANHLLQRRGLIASGSVILLASAAMIATAGAAAPAVFIASGLFGNWMIVMGNIKKDPLDLPPV